MNESTLIWLFGIIGAWLLLLSGLWYHTKEDMKKMRLAIELFVDGIGKGAAMVLHSPDNHLQFDEWADKYLSRHYEFSFAEWQEMREECDRIIADETYTRLERGQATMLKFVCAHKLLMKPYLARKTS